MNYKNNISSRDFIESTIYQKALQKRVLLMRKEKNIQTTTQLFELKENVFAQRMTNFMNKKKQKKNEFQENKQQKISN